jgi:hypothetical protein
LRTASREYIDSVEDGTVFSFTSSFLDYCLALAVSRLVLPSNTTHFSIVKPSLFLLVRNYDYTSHFFILDKDLSKNSVNSCIDRNSRT